MVMLEDVRVLDFSHVYFGPYATMILGDMGAEVIKIEPPWGEMARLYPPLFGGMSSAFLYLNRNKKGMTLNLKDPRAVKIALQLVEKSDVLVENFKRGTMDKLGLGYEDVKKVKPDIIYASLSGFGLDGPYSSRPSFAPIASAMSGWYRLTGDILDPKGPPIRPAEWHGDLDPALWAVISILGALRHRDKTGEGQLIDVSQLDCMIAQTGVSITRYMLSGELPWEAEKKYMGLNTFGMFKAQDGWIYLAAEPQMLDRLLRAMHIETLEKREQLEQWIAERRVSDVVAAMVSESVPVAPILQINETVEDSHVKARGIIVEMDHPTAGKVKAPGFPIKFSKHPVSPHLPAPILGQHNDEILTDLLGYSKDEVNELRKSSVIT